MTRTDNKDGTWDILFDNDAEVFLDVDIDMYSANTMADDIWCPIKKERIYSIIIYTPTNKTLASGKRVVNQTTVATEYEPYIKDGFFCYTNKNTGIPVTMLLPMQELSGIETMYEERDILRKADGKNPLLFHYKYGESYYHTVKF